MPKRKVAQAVIVYRDGQRLKPAIGEIFDFTDEEMQTINRINPEALTRPIIAVDVENEAAQAEAKAAAEAEAKAAAEAKAKGGKAKSEAKNTDSDEV